MTATNIYDLVGNICTDIGANYYYGSFKEIQKHLINSIRNKKPIASRYPLVCLITDTKEDVNVNPNNDTSYTLHLVIINTTKPNYTSAQRVAANYTPTLWPLYNSLVDGLRKYADSDFSELPHEKRDVFYYSPTDAKEANQLAEWLDAVEMTGVNLLVNFREKECNI